MIRYRTYRNTDPPALIEVWNECFTGRGAYPLRSAGPLEFALFSKPYFDSQGLVVAEKDDQIVGFVLAGFGPDPMGKNLNHEMGIVCVLAVRTAHRRQGIGSELLRRAEAYVRSRGAQEVIAGQVRPYTPFLFGVYGNADLPGFLNSDRLAAPFFEKHGYSCWRTTQVLERQLQSMDPIIDQRFLSLRRRYDLQLIMAPELHSWWQNCVLGSIEPVEFRLLDRLTGIPSARALIWEMNAFRGTGVPMAGIIDLNVRPDAQRQGLARFLLSQMMRYLQEQFFRLIEIQCHEDLEPCIQLVRGLGFEQVDVGRSFRKAFA